ncbi:hypothetical protein BDW69DRAFT_186134 [Aspergillus filifer]
MANRSPFAYCALLLLLLVQLTNSQVISFDRGSDGNPVLARKDGEPALIITASNEHKGVVCAAHDLALDFGRVLRVNGTVYENASTTLKSTLDGDVAVLVGTIGKSTIIDDLAKNGKIDVSPVRGKFPRISLGNYFTAEFHKLIFELLLRCTANYFWPGMKEKAFYVDDPENGPLADLYGIFLGTSHHEPLARAYWEQDEYLAGSWDWSENESNITAFMEEGLEEMISLQQGMIDNITNKKLEQVPQTWALYKEVGKYWQAGMEVSDLVTLMWTDENFGNMLTIQLVKTWEQMHLAYSKGAKTIWICNSQDLKPYEVPTAHFLAIAYDMTLFETPESTTAWLVRWAAQQFGVPAAVTTAEIINNYGRLIVRRKYETLTMNPFAYSTPHYDEALKVMQEWRELAKLAQATYDSLDGSLKPSFFQLVLHPVLAGSTVNQHQRAAQVHQLFARDAELARQYNGLFNGRWNHIIDDAHIGYSGRNPPSSNVMPPLAYVADNIDNDVLGVAIQGQDTPHTDESLVLRSVDPYMPPTETRYIDIFTRANGTFSYIIQTNASYVSITNARGTLIAPGNSSDARAVISMDRTKAPQGTSSATFHILRTNNSNSSGSGNNSTIKATVHLPLTNPAIPTSYKGYISSNGAISIEAAHWSNAESTNGTSYIEIPYYGRTLSGVKTWPVTSPSLTPATGPKLSYDFYATSSVQSAELTCLLGASLDHDPTSPLRLAYAVDDEMEPQTVRVFADYPAGEHPRDWDTGVIRGVGSIWLLEPGVVLEKVMVDLGGLLGTSLGAPESFLKE